MRRRILSLLALFALASATLDAQGFLPAQAPPWVFADSYGRWAIQGQLPNTFTRQVSGVSPCQITQLNYGDAPTFLATGSAVALAPVFVDDATAANAEVITPSRAFSGSASCGWILATTYPHITFSLQSGTGGLQEAINAVGASTAAYATVVYLTPQWYKLVAGISSLNATLASQVTPANILAAATCTSKVFVVDLTTLPATDYICSGGSLTVVPSTAATSLAGGAKGSAPYQSAASTTAFLTSPTTTGHTFVYAWAPSGSAVDPEVLDITPALAVTFLPGLTGTITGTALTATCDSGTATVTGAAAGDPVTASATTGADVGGAFNLRASVTSANTVTVYVCGTGTPASLAYNVVVQHAASY